MMLEDAVASLDQLDEDLLICARKPWSRSSEIVLVSSEDGRVANDVTDAGYTYFLEVSVAREVLQVFARPPSMDEKLDCLLYYAENDAYPDWIYS